MTLDSKRIMVLLAAGSFSALGLCGCRTEVMGAREELAPATRDYMSEYEGKEEDLAALNQRRREAGKPPYATTVRNAGASGSFEPMTPINPAELPAKSAPAATKGGTYKVVAGDNLTKIAKKNHTTVSKLAAANNMDPNGKLYVGQKLVIPGASGAVSAPKKKAAASSKTSRQTASAEVSGGLYTVKPGDSIDRIARRTGVKRTDLLAANQLTTSSVLRVGQKLVIPGAATAVAAAPQTEKTAAPAKTATAAPAEDKSNPDDTLNSLIKDLGAAEEKSAPAASPAPAEADVLSTTEILHDIKVGDFAARYDYSLDQLKAANKDNWPADGVFKAGSLIRLPQ